jgi:MFS family permease
MPGRRANSTPQSCHGPRPGTPFDVLPPSNRRATLLYESYGTTGGRIQVSAPSALKPEYRARWGPVCGVLFVVLMVVSSFIFSTPSTSKSPQYLLNWYSQTSHRRQVNISTVIADVAVVLGLFWFGYLKDRFSRSDLGARFSSIFLGGVVLFASGGLVFSGAQFALGDDPKKMEPATAQTLNFLASDIGAAGILVGVSVLMWAAGFIILKTRVLPRWLAWFSFVLAVVALAGPIGFFAFLATGIWVLIVAFYMWRHEEALPVADGTPERSSTVAAASKRYPEGDVRPR